MVIAIATILALITITTAILVWARMKNRAKESLTVTNQIHRFIDLATCGNETREKRGRTGLQKIVEGDDKIAARLARATLESLN